MSDQVLRLNGPMVERLRRCAADTSSNWAGEITIYPPEARELVALIDAAPIIRAEVAEGIAQAIEASIVTDHEQRYANCTCLEGAECHPHACHRVMNKVRADEDTWPVHVKIGVWRELDPLIRNHAAAIARGYTHTGQDPADRKDNSQ